jgi:hypothetical protein
MTVVRYQTINSPGAATIRRTRVPDGLTVHDDQTHAEVLALVDELLAIEPGRGGSPAAGVGQTLARDPSGRLCSGTAQ